MPLCSSAQACELNTLIFKTHARTSAYNTLEHNAKRCLKNRVKPIRGIEPIKTFIALYYIREGARRVKFNITARIKCSHGWPREK
jgi:hypothetical protein